MTEKQNDICHGIIHSAALTAGAIGASPIPGSDTIPICATQTAMIIALGVEFDIKIDDAYAISLVKQFAAKEAGKFIASSFCKIIPGFGSAVCSTVAFSLTEALGWETARAFEKKSLEQKALVVS